MAGSGIRAVAQVTQEARAAVENADVVLYAVADSLTEKWLKERSSRVESLNDSYRAGRPLADTYEDMVRRILAEVRRGLRVCALFYGHPGVFVYSSHEAIRRARAEGFPAVMLPGISAADCLFADLQVDPSLTGCQMLEATDLLLYQRTPSTSMAVILWQIGFIGQTEYSARGTAGGRLDLLHEYLLTFYPATHTLTLYDAPQLPLAAPRIRPIALSELPSGEVRATTTLYIPPLHSPSPDAAWAERLQLDLSQLLRVGESLRLGPRGRGGS